MQPAVFPDVPSISVVMSVYNGLPLVADAIDSILSQSFGDFEFIIVNDGSTDDTLALLRSYAERDQRIRIIDQVNSGLTKALITGVAEARAPLIARMDADDLSLPLRFERQVALLVARPDLVAVSCGIEYVAHDLRHLSVSARRSDEAALPLLMAFSNAISGHGQMIYRKAAYEAAGGYDPDFRFAQDYDLWCRMLTLGPIGEAEGVHYRFRVGDGHDSITTRHGKQQGALAVEIASRQHERLFGNRPDEQLVRDTLALCGYRFKESMSTTRLLAVDGHLRRATRQYAQAHPEAAPAIAAAEREFAELWANAYRNASSTAPSRKALLAALATRWDPTRAVRVLGKKLGLGAAAPPAASGVYG